MQGFKYFTNLVVKAIAISLGEHVRSYLLDKREISAKWPSSTGKLYERW